MNDYIIKKIVEQINITAQYYTAIWGFLGVLIGAVLAIFGNIVMKYLNDRKENRLDKKRKKILIILLQDERFTWRKITTLSRVIGAEFEKTKQLLIEIDARGSQDDNELWCLISRKPLKDIKNQ